MKSADVLRVREEFLKALTVDGPTNDRRRKDYNQSIFAPEELGGYACFNGTSLDMVMDKFDRAVRLVFKERHG